MQSVQKNIVALFIALLIFFSGNNLSLHAAWSPPVQISTGPSSTNITGTPLVIDSNSMAMVGWLDGPIGVAQTLSSATWFVDAATWSSPLEIYTNTVPGVFPSFPTMSVDIFGNQVAAFSLIDPMAGSLMINASRLLVGESTWQAPFSQQINGIPGSSSVAVDTLGNVAALLAVSLTGTSPFDITLIQLPAGSSAWSPQVILAQDNSMQPAVAAKTYLGHGAFAWKVNMPTLRIQTLRFNFLTQESSAMLDVPLPPLTTDIRAIDIAVDSFGDAIIVYVAQIGAGNALYSSTLLAGEDSTWSAPLLISDPANTIVGFSIASDAIGNTTILWGEEISPTQQFLRVATLPLSGVPTFVTDLTDRTTPNTLIDATSRVVMDSFGNAAAIWAISMGGPFSVQVSTKAVGQNWTAAETLSTSGFFPLITLSDQGTAVAAWIDSGTAVLMGSRNLFLFALTPPFNFIGKIITDKFLLQTAYLLKMHWDPSPAPHILNYQLFKNGQLIATISKDGPFKFIQQLHSKHIKGTYTLVATASNGNTSSPVVLEKK